MSRVHPRPSPPTGAPAGVPDVPAWIAASLEAAPRRWAGEVDGATIQARVWDGPSDRPTIVLVHGGAAHAAWWDVVAPLLPGGTVVAVDLSGHGDSHWRDRYAFPGWADEVLAVAAAVAPGAPPVLLGHSLGGIVAAMAAARGGRRIGGLITVDSPLLRTRPATIGDADAVFGAPKRYRTAEEAGARFRILPEQPVAHPALLAHVARESVREVADGWTWKFDPRAFATDPDDRPADVGEVLGEVDAPVGAIVGERSAIVPPSERERLRCLVTPADGGLVVIPGGHHHLMFDAPRQLVTAVGDILGGWQRTSSPPTTSAPSSSRPDRP